MRHRWWPCAQDALHLSDSDNFLVFNFLDFGVGVFDLVKGFTALEDYRWALEVAIMFGAEGKGERAGGFPP